MSADPAQDHVELRSAYADSVALLQVSRDVQALPGVVTAQVAMATPLNLEVITGLGFEVPAAASPHDMVVALRLDGDGDLAAALAAVDRSLAPAAPTPGGSGAPTVAASHHRLGARRAPGDRAGVGARDRARSSRRWTPSTPAAT